MASLLLDIHSLSALSPLHVTYLANDRTLNNIQHENAMSVAEELGDNLDKGSVG
jgi:hypothetical protein